MNARLHRQILVDAAGRTLYMFTLRGVVVRGGTDRTADQLRARVALLERRLMELERSTLPVLADPLRPLNAGAFTGERSEVELPLDPRQMRR